MNKIFKFNEFINEAAVAVPQILKDFVDFLEKSPVIKMHPEDAGDKVRQGWITKEHKLYSIPGINKYFEEKYGKDYSHLNVSNAIQYDPNIKKLTKMLAEKDMTLQTTSLKGQFGDTTWFYSVNLSDSELESIKSKYEEEFSKRYSGYKDKKEAGKKVVAKVTASKRGKKATKSVKEAMDMLMECLLQKNK